MQVQFCGRRWGRFPFPCCLLSRSSQQVSCHAQSHFPGSSRDFSYLRIKSPWQSLAEGRLFLSQSGIFPTRSTLWEQQSASRQTLGLSHLQPGQCDWLEELQRLFFHRKEADYEETSVGNDSMETKKVRFWNGRQTNTEEDQYQKRAISLTFHEQIVLC